MTATQARLEVHRFPGEDPVGPVDGWLLSTHMAPRGAGPYHIALITLWLGELPPWMDYTFKSISYAREQGLAPLFSELLRADWPLSGVHLFVIGDNKHFDLFPLDKTDNVHLVYVPLSEIINRLERALLDAGVPVKSL